MIQRIGLTAGMLLLSGAFLLPAMTVSTAAQAEVAIGVDFWGEPGEYQIWCRQYYRSCVPWERLPPEWRTRYQGWWGHRHPHEHWGRGARGHGHFRGDHHHR